jgi:hypothetical protein
MNLMERTQLLNELVIIDALIVKANLRAASTANNRIFERIIEEIRELSVSVRD